MKDQFFDCNRDAGWRSISVNSNDLETVAVRDLVDRVFTTDALVPPAEFNNGPEDPRSRPQSVSYYIFDDLYGDKPRFATLMECDRNKVELFVRALKFCVYNNISACSRPNDMDPNIPNEFIWSYFLYDVPKPLNYNCSNELAQFIDLVATVVDACEGAGSIVTNVEEFIENSLTLSKRTSLERMAQDIVFTQFSDNGKEQSFNAEFQLYLKHEIGVLLSLHNLPNLAGDMDKKIRNYMRVFENPLMLEGVCKSFADHLCKELSNSFTICYERLEDGAEESVRLKVFNNMRRIGVSYEEFCKILECKYVAESFEMYCNQHFVGEDYDAMYMSSADGNKDESKKVKKFDERLEEFVNRVNENGGGEFIQDLIDWCDGKEDKKVLTIEELSVIVSLFADKAYLIPELCVFGSSYNFNAGAAWMGIILAPIYLHKKGIIRLF